MPWEGWVKSNSWVYTADLACVFRQPKWDKATDHFWSSYSSTSRFRPQEKGM